MEPDAGSKLLQLIEQHYALLYRYAYRLSGSSADGEDLTQQTFLTAQTHLDELRDAERGKSWLCSILRNLYLKERRHRACVTVQSIEDVVEPAGVVDDVPFDAERLQHLLNELPEEFRSTLILFYFEAFSYKDVAEQMGVAVGTVMSRLSRGKAWLRQRLSKPAISPEQFVADTTSMNQHGANQNGANQNGVNPVGPNPVHPNNLKNPTSEASLNQQTLKQNAAPAGIHPASYSNQLTRTDFRTRTADRSSCQPATRRHFGGGTLMDCLTARQLMELPPATAGEADALQAQQHVEECEPCLAVLESRRRFDRRIGEVCRDVPVPAGLKDRLLAAATARMAASAPSVVAQEETPSLVQSAPLSEAGPKQRSRSRRWVLVVGSAAMLLCAVSLAIVCRPTAPTISFDAVADAVTAPALVAERLPPFAGFKPSTAFASPLTLQLPRAGGVAAVVRSAPRLITVKGQPCACYFFSVANRRKQPVAGRLLVLPRSAIQNPSALPNTLPTMGAWSMAAWSEGDLAYLLTVAGHDELQHLSPQNVAF